MIGTHALRRNFTIHFIFIILYCAFDVLKINFQLHTNRKVDYNVEYYIMLIRSINRKHAFAEQLKYISIKLLCKKKKMLSEHRFRILMAMRCCDHTGQTHYNHIKFESNYFRIPKTLMKGVLF